jgi:predicted acylesterase/phospholipase RssA
MRIPPKRLLFSGGGLRVLSYLGVIQVLEEKQLLKHVREFCGVSAGAFVATMLALEYSLPTIQRFCFEYDFAGLRNIEPESFLEFIETFGIDNGETLNSLIIKLLKHKNYPPTATMRDIPNLRIWASDLQQAKLIEFSAEKTPDIEVCFALRASMAFPLYFVPMKHPDTGHLLADGGIYDNYPILSLTPQQREETIGCTFEWSKFPIDIPDISRYISLLFSGYYMPCYQFLIKQHRNKTIVIPCGEFPALHFEASLEEKQGLVECGRKAALKFLLHPPKYNGRRNSVS